MRSRRGLRMILHAEYGMIAMAETFERIVVQIGVSNFDFVEIERVGIDREAVIMRGDLDLARNLINSPDDCRRDGRTSACTSSRRARAENLMPQADPENRYMSDHASRPAPRIFERLGIARTVGETRRPV